MQINPYEEIADRRPADFFRVQSQESVNAMRLVAVVFGGLLLGGSLLAAYFSVITYPGIAITLFACLEIGTIYAWRVYRYDQYVLPNDVFYFGYRGQDPVVLRNEEEIRRGKIEELTKLQSVFAKPCRNLNLKLEHQCFGVKATARVSFSFWLRTQAPHDVERWLRCQVKWRETIQQQYQELVEAAGSSLGVSCLSKEEISRKLLSRVETALHQVVRVRFSIELQATYYDVEYESIVHFLIEQQQRR